MKTRLGLIALVFAALAADRAGANGIDRRLVGTYRHMYTYVSGSFTGIHEQSLTLRADGTCEIAAKVVAGDEYNTLGIGRNARVTHRGTWSVEGRTMHLNWQNVRAERIAYDFGYTGGGWKLELGAPGRRKLWTKIR